MTAASALPSQEGPGKSGVTKPRRTAQTILGHPSCWIWNRRQFANIRPSARNSTSPRPTDRPTGREIGCRIPYGCWTEDGGFRAEKTRGSKRGSRASTLASACRFMSSHSVRGKVRQNHTPTLPQSTIPPHPMTCTTSAENTEPGSIHSPAEPAPDRNPWSLH